MRISRNGDVTCTSWWLALLQIVETADGDSLPGFPDREGVVHLAGPVELSSSVLGVHHDIMCTATTEGLDDVILETPKFTVEFKGSTCLEQRLAAASSATSCKLTRKRNDIITLLCVPSYMYLGCVFADPPEITCPETLINTRPHSEDVAFNCSVHADPPLDDFHVTFPTHLNATRTLTGPTVFSNNLRVTRIKVRHV